MKLILRPQNILAIRLQFFLLLFTTVRGVVKKKNFSLFLIFMIRSDAHCAAFFLSFVSNAIFLELCIHFVYTKAYFFHWFDDYCRSEASFFIVKLFRIQWTIYIFIAILWTIAACVCVTVFISFGHLDTEWNALCATVNKYCSTIWYPATRTVLLLRTANSRLSSCQFLTENSSSSSFRF